MGNNNGQRRNNGNSKSKSKGKSNSNSNNKSTSNNNSNNNSDSNSNPSSDYVDLIAARLGYIGAIIATIGDGVAAIAAGIALRKLEEASLAESRSEVDQFRQTENIQQQVDFYINELIQIRKMIK
ncbi:hypothetical protein PghCCS26_45460 [Paenibacillus glycanilyticus]|uniref:Translation initiation factor 2 n=1 Tax=Paenibacillus glycanilyticus TaxID=126569 RepID=A0ABQ6NQQ5_9BACL|nr:hypothetical protein [Paenibacillus glycanilyticus]GMK47416.1 hypothetical protein PghCCS26_45460 [Paenibacillus glycanilyticus]